MSGQPSVFRGPRLALLGPLNPPTTPFSKLQKDTKRGFRRVFSFSPSLGLGQGFLLIGPTGGLGPGKLLDACYATLCVTMSVGRLVCRSVCYQEVFFSLSTAPPNPHATRVAGSRSDFEAL